MPLSSKAARVAAWCLTIWGACLVYLYSWGGFSSLSEDSAAGQTKEEAVLSQNLALTERAGLYDLDLYKSQHQLAMHYIRSEKYQDAERLMKAAMNTAQLAFGNNSAERYGCLSLLAAIYRDAKNYSQSERSYLELLEIDKRKKSADQTMSVCRDLNNLGVLYFLWGKSFYSPNRRIEKFRFAKGMFKNCLQILASKPNERQEELSAITKRNYTALMLESGDL